MEQMRYSRARITCGFTGHPVNKTQLLPVETVRSTGQEETISNCVEYFSKLHYYPVTVRRHELVGGGLIRSLGGWAEVLALRGRGEKEVSDQRVLGDGEFVETVLSEIDDLGKVNLRLARKRMDLSSFAKRLCKVREVSIGELRSGSRRHEIVEARRVFSWLAVKELGYSGAEVARYLGVTTSCVTRAASSGEEPERKGYI